jgi:16S rRNA (guanine527-N7)-methyltransferase
VPPYAQAALAFARQTMPCGDVDRSAYRAPGGVRSDARRAHEIVAPVIDRSSADGRSSAASLPPELAIAARRLFGDRLPLAIEYAEALATDGVVRGLIGPREAPRLWERHLLNCAALTELIPSKASVVDVGSGAGLPGIVLAVARPDVTIALVEPLARRAAFLSEMVALLDLSGVTVMRGRAEESVGLFDSADVVTARAVAPLDRLAGWCLPLAKMGGRLLAVKGASAAEEVALHRAAVHRLGGSEPVIRMCGGDALAVPTTVVEVVRDRVVAGRGPASGGPDRGRARRMDGRRTRH